MVDQREIREGDILIKRPLLGLFGTRHYLVIGVSPYKIRTRVMTSVGIGERRRTFKRDTTFYNRIPKEDRLGNSKKYEYIRLYSKLE